MAETGVDYGLLQQILDEQGYLVMRVKLGKLHPGSVVDGRFISVGWSVCRGVKVVCVGDATLEDWLDQGRKFFGGYKNRYNAGATFVKVVAE